MQEIQTFFGAVTISGTVLAALNCFLGFKLQKLWIVLYGAMLGATLGAAILPEETAKWIMICVALVIGVLFGALAFKLYKLGVFLFCLALASLLVCRFVPLTGWALAGVCLVAGILLGLLAIRFTRDVLIISTAIQGGFVLADSFCNYTGVLNWDYGEILLLIVGVVLTFAGVAVQYKTTKPL